jgi:hypothetical protein
LSDDRIRIVSTCDGGIPSRDDGAVNVGEGETQIRSPDVDAYDVAGIVGCGWKLKLIGEIGRLLHHH